MADYFVEGHEETRYDAHKKAMQAMAEIAGDAKATTEDRIKAAKVVNEMSDSYIRAYIMGDITKKSDDTNKKLLNKLDKLDA